MKNVKIKVIETKSTGFLPDMGTLFAKKTEDLYEGFMYEISDERAGSYNGVKLREDHVLEVE